MAKENFVALIGQVHGSPLINEAKGTAKYTLQTYRRNDKTDYPTVTILDSSLLEEVKTFKEGDIVLVKGIIAGFPAKKGAECPYCKVKNIVDGTVTEVIAIMNKNLGSKHNLMDFKEISSQVFLLGSLCVNPSYRVLDTSKTASCQYQVAINRKLHVRRQADVFSDYLWVNSFAKQADEDIKRPQVKSQVFINGGIQTRPVERKCVCQSCEKTFKIQEMVAEIVPYSVEYLNNCKFDDKNEETAAINVPEAS
jgi:single-stranded DNA-binding protein